MLYGLFLELFSPCWFVIRVTSPVSYLQVQRTNILVNGGLNPKIFFFLSWILLRKMNSFILNQFAYLGGEKSQVLFVKEKNQDTGYDGFLIYLSGTTVFELACGCCVHGVPIVHQLHKIETTKGPRIRSCPHHPVMSRLKSSVSLSMLVTKHKK